MIAVFALVLPVLLNMFRCTDGHYDFAPTVTNRERINEAVQASGPEQSNAKKKKERKKEKKKKEKDNDGKEKREKLQREHCTQIGMS